LCYFPLELPRPAISPWAAAGPRSGELIDTLRTYFENRSSVSLAAQVLGVQVHTVEYRLSRLEELTELSLRNAEQRLTLAMRIPDLAGLGVRQPE
jgi:DNA-binding PucR family transcriptional regulator